MAGEAMLSDIKARLGEKGIYELRQIARVVGVSRPADGKKERLIDEIILIASCRLDPAPRSSRGAPPKACEYDKELVTDIEDCRTLFLSAREGTKIVSEEIGVSDNSAADMPCSGILARGEKNWFLRVNGPFGSPDDVFVNIAYINRFNLKEGDYVEGRSRSGGDDRAQGLTAVAFVNGRNPDSVNRTEFTSLTPVHPDKRIKLFASSGDITARTLDYFAPAGKGQRTVISAPANADKSAIIEQIATGISLNHPEILTAVLLIGARPEDVTEIRRNLSGITVFHTTFDMPEERHIYAVEFVQNYLKRQVENGKDVALIADGISRLDINTARSLLASARNTEEGASFTVFAAVNGDDLTEDANSIAYLADETVDVTRSYTRKCELLTSAAERAAAENLRRNHSVRIAEIFKEIQNNEQITERYS